MPKPFKELPYQYLGNQLRILREHIHESLTDVSGAVEIDEAQLAKIENGSERPSEDILMLLISHFGLEDNQAVKLWELAGYNSFRDKDNTSDANLDEQALRSVVVMMALDTRILYTDQVHVAATKKGIVINFLQQSKSDQHIPISRIGMSYEQAQDLFKVLGATIQQGKLLREPKFLPMPNDPSNKNQNLDNNIGKNK